MNKTFEKILERLKKEAFYLCDDLDNDTEVVTLKDVKEIVHEVAEEYNGGWISCSERLPECRVIDNLFHKPKQWMSNPVLVTVKSEECDGIHYYVAIDYMSGYGHENNIDWMKNCFVGGSAIYHQEIVAWMPLPESYKS